MNNNFIKKTLKNGVRLYLYIDKSMKQTFVSYSINYGSNGSDCKFYLDDKEYNVLPGCAHFLEHLLGEHSKYGNFYNIFTERKYQKNGWTDMNYTDYFFYGVEDIKTSIKELINSIDDPVFTSEDIKKTSEAICEETKMGRDNKYRVAYSIIKRNLYKDIELVSDTLNVIGDEKTTKEINYEMLKTCYEAFYTNDNKILLIAGNLDELEMTQYIESIYSELKSHKNRRKEYNYSLDGIRKEIQIEYMPTLDDVVYFGFRNAMNSKFDRKKQCYYTRFILESKFATDSEFIEKLKKDDIITTFEERSYSFYKNDLHIILGASVKKQEEFITLLKEELKNSNFESNDFELYKRKIISEQALRVDYKYDTLKNFVFRLECTDDFDDIEFIKTLTFEEFLEFYDSLNYDLNTTAVIRDKDGEQND